MRRKKPSAETETGGEQCMTIELLLQYVTYAAIIVVGILILGLIKRVTKLPSHAELKKRLEALRSEISDFIEEGHETEKSSYDYFRQMEKCAGKANKLAYTVTLMAQKERDGNLDEIATLMTEAFESIAPYKFKSKETQDMSGLVQAIVKTEKAIASIDLILERDKDLRAKHAR